MTALPEVHRYVLSNGSKVLIRPTPYKDILCLSVTMAVGGRDDPAQQSGLTNLLSRLLTKGAGRRSALEIAETIESIGGDLDTYCTNDYAGIETQTVAGDWQTALDLLTDCLFEPTLLTDEVEKEKSLVKAQIRCANDDKFSYTYRRFEKMYYQGHPYALSVHGESKTVDALDRDAVVALHRRTFRPENALFVAVGNVPEDEFLKMLEQRWPKCIDVSGKAVLRSVAGPHNALDSAGRAIALTREVEQSFAVLGYPSPTAGEPDGTALRLVCGLLGEGMSSRLFTNLRERRHLAYAVGSSLVARELAAHAFLYIGTHPSTLEQASDGLRAEVDRIVREGVPEDELERARQYLLGRFLVGRQTNSSLARGMSTAEMWNLGWSWAEEFPERLQAVTVDLANQAAARYFAVEPACATLSPPVAATEA
jgi:zinc protease